ncbi:lipid phosphate phosphatase epsilon 2, chloroplastic isoform X1 [Sesamum indicum]|uniref:Lipid phosphate phosphatase epsilon 2, chloroplastic isoform X1 n=1 Tax=Sesamum indicum TaxID=4182 RepID=A0A6I9TQ04_SESIN|nr:lipid phosphate phosphatase epsilon 2, chloroplastic isoform X1 [Sesamum indicum]
MSAIFVSSLAVASFSASQSRKPQKPIKICAKSLRFGGLFGRRQSVCWATLRNQSIMTNPIEVRITDEGVKAFEQEALVEDSTNLGAGGLEATLNGLSKWFVSALFAAIILWRHDAEALWAAMGAVLNAVLSITLKKVLNQERPISTSRSDPGMPSSHAQSIFYTITFLNLSMLEWYGVNALTATLSGFFLIVGSYFSWLRVSQRLHTLSQVIVGAVLGSFFSIFWSWLWNSFILKFFISFLWVRIVVILGAIGYCSAFLIHVYRTWILEEL